MNQGAQAVDRVSESGLTLADLGGGSEYLLLEDVIRLLHFDRTAPSQPRVACWKWLQRKGVRLRARRWVRRADLLAVLESE